MIFLLVLLTADYEYHTIHRGMFPENIDWGLDKKIGAETRYFHGALQGNTWVVNSKKNSNHHRISVSYNPPTVGPPSITAPELANVHVTFNCKDINSKQCAKEGLKGIHLSWTADFPLWFPELKK